MASYLLDDLADILSSGGVTATIYRGYLPPTPVEAVLLLETGGFPPVHAMSASAGNAVEELPTVQVTRRSATMERAIADMNVIFRLLDGFGDRTINDTHYKWIGAMQSPFPLPLDETKQHLRICNFVVAKALSTSTST